MLIKSLLAAAGNGIALPDGSSPEEAAANAVQLIAAGQTQNGDYWILVGGVPTQVYCDLTGGGWMYLIPPISAINQNPFGVTYAVTASLTNCQTDAVYTTQGDWYSVYSYRCGSGGYIQQILSWTNNMNTTEIRFAAVAQGNQYRWCIHNGVTLGPNRSSGPNYYYSDSSPVCSTNVCWQSATHWNAAVPLTRPSVGDLTIDLYAGPSSSPNSNYGMSVAIGKVAIR